MYAGYEVRPTDATPEANLVDGQLMYRAASINGEGWFAAERGILRHTIVDVEDDEVVTVRLGASPFNNGA